MANINQDFIDQYSKLLIYQYREKPNAVAEIKSRMKNYSKIFNVLSDFVNVFDVDSATGAQLDLIGRIVGIDRSIQPVLDLISLGLINQLATQDTKPSGIAFNSGRTKLYEIGKITQKIYQYDLSTAGDISTATLSQSISTSDVRPEDIHIAKDDTKLYELGRTTQKIYEYDLSTAGDISTATLNQSVTTQDAIPTGITFNEAGDKLYEIGQASQKIYELKLGTSYDVGTGSLNATKTTSSAEPEGIDINVNGIVLYEIGSNAGVLYQYTMNNAFDLSTADLDRRIQMSDVDPKDIITNAQFLRIYELGQNTQTIYEYFPDRDFRLFVKAKIAKNYSSGYLVSDDEITLQDVYRFVFGDSAFVLDSRSHDLVLYVDETVQDAQVKRLKDTDLLPRPAGVQLKYTIKADADTHFGFTSSVNPSGFGVGKFGRLVI